MDQMRHFAEARFGVSEGFVVHLRKALEDAVQAGREDIAAVLQQNHDEETGKSSQPNDGHAIPRHAFYKVLGVDVEADQSLIPDVDALAFNQTISRLVTHTGGAGVILFREFATPIEFSAMRNQCRLLMPEVFGLNKPEEKDAKLAVHYLDDHISHDADSHGPDLLEAIQRHADTLDGEDRKTFITDINTEIVIAATITGEFYKDMMKRVTMDISRVGIGEC